LEEASVTASDLDHLGINQVIYIVFDFETVTPKGRSPGPIELGALRINAGFEAEIFLRLLTLWGTEPQVKRVHYL
jgi:hypothetical protein